MLTGINHGHDPSVQFKDADVVICIGLAREYEFTEDEYTDPFFKDYVLTSKFYVLRIILWYDFLYLNLLSLLS